MRGTVERVLLWCLTLGAACRAEPLVPTSGLKYVSQTIDEQPRNGVDLLFVVDNSSGMAAKQQALVASFPALVRALRAAAGGLPDLRVGVVSSNMGAGGSRLAECDQSDRGLLQGPTTGCAAHPTGRFLVSLAGGTRNNFDGDLTAAFPCLASLGTGGCGFEQHLASARRALDTDQPLENEGFLRPEALLALVVLADEDDCSTKAATDLFEPSTSRYGPQTSFRCAEYGHLCAGAPPPRAAAGPLPDCHPAETAGKLVPVADYVSFFRSLKTQPDRVLVSVIAAPPAPYAVQLVDGQPQLAPSCQSANGTGTPGVRLKAFADAFGGHGMFGGVCDQDLSPPLGRLGDAIVKQLGAACLVRAPVERAGVPDCRVSESAAGLGPAVSVPRCAAGGPRPCWTTTANKDQCASGLELKIDRGATTVLPGTVATAICQVCTDANDPRCR